MTRTSFRFAVAALALAAIVPAASHAVATCEVVSDPAGDEGANPYTMAVWPPGSGDAIDLRSISMRTTSDDLVVTIRVTDLDAPLSPDADSAGYSVGWYMDGREDSVHVTARRVAGGWTFGWFGGFPATVAVLPTPDDPLQVNFSAEPEPIEGSVDAASNEIRLVLPLETIGNPAGGTTLEWIYVHSLEARLLASGDGTLAHGDFRWPIVSDDAPPEENWTYVEYSIGQPC